MSGDATQDRFLGAMLGLAIGDAYGMPVAGWSPTTIADFYGAVTGYLPRKFRNGDEIHPGEITDETEIALCIIESVTAAHGELDVENIGIRMIYLARGDSKRWMNSCTVDALENRSEAAGFQLPLIDDEEVAPDVIARGIPIGLMHSMGHFDPVMFANDSEAVARITHGSPFARSVIETVARAIALATRQSVPLSDLAGQLLIEIGEGQVKDELLSRTDNGDRESRKDENSSTLGVIDDALRIVAGAQSFQEVMEQAVAPGGASDTRAALAGAIYAGHHGSSAIPQRLIDGLEARIYVSLAAPWFYRTVAKRSGRSIDLRFRQDRF